MKEGNDRIHVPEDREVPMLVLHEQVLLPTAFARISLSATSQRSMALVQYLLQQPGGHTPLLAVVPAGMHAGPDGKAPLKPLPAPLQGGAADRKLVARDQHASVGRASQRSARHVSSASEEQELSRLHGIGTVARVLQMTRSSESGDWVLALEGLCRVRVSAISAMQPYHSATLQQLDRFPASDPRHEAELELSPEAADTTAQLQRVARQLLGMVSLTIGAPAATRLAEMLESSLPAQSADLLAAVLTPTPPVRLAILDAVDVDDRLQLVLQLAKAALRTAGQAVGAPGDSANALSSGPSDKSTAARTKALQRLQAAQRRLQGGPMFQMGGPRRGSGAAESAEDEDELAELAGRIDRAGMPPDVHKVAVKELKRLQRSNEQAPGYAISRTYVETLADLPWNRFATHGPQQQQQQQQQRTEDEQQAGSGGDEASSADAATTDLEGRPAAADSASDDPASQPEDAAAALPSRELSLAEARALLDAHHHGLDKVKTRILQYLAVRRLRGPDAHAPILAFFGPPGVGKTSLARSVAAALGRPFQRISLGGVRDEAEIRGHRRTYIGALPGRIIQAVRRAGVRDGMLLLDEVDKMGRDARGDPSSALLEVLDPEQNAAFTDTYLGVPFDLSKVVFLATGNSLAGIPPPLLDRLEIIHLSGYTLDEKVHIAAQHLVPQLLEEHGLTGAQLAFPAEALELVAAGYTREAGVRSLSRALAAICRHVAVNVVAASDGAAANAEAAAPLMPSEDPGSSEYESPAQSAACAAEATRPARSGTDAAAGLPAIWRWGAAARRLRQRQQLAPLQASSAGQAVLAESSSPADGTFHDMPHQQVVVDEALIEEVLGPRRFGENDAAQRVSGAGSVAGLVWTEAGGQVQYVECIATGPGQADSPGSLTLTGQMGEVLEESAHIALSWIRAHASRLPLLPADGTADPAAAGDSTRSNVHIHLPAGAIPKDGPSAGVTLAAALASLHTGRPARADTAMTGELTLRGLVLPVGGVKEKLIAAHQAGMTRVIIPARNMRDVKADLPAAVRDALEIIPAERLDQVLAAAFDPPLELQPLRSKM